MPVSTIIFQGGEVFQPVAGIQVIDLSASNLDFTHGWLMDVSADDSIYATIRTVIDGQHLKVLDVFDSLLDPCLHLVGEGQIRQSKRCGSG